MPMNLVFHRPRDNSTKAMGHTKAVFVPSSPVYPTPVATPLGYNLFCFDVLVIAWTFQS